MPTPLHGRRTPGLGFRSLSSPSVATQGRRFGPLTPLSAGPYSALRSGTLPRAKASRDEPRFVPRRDAGHIMSFSLQRMRRLLGSKVFWLVIVLLGLVYSWARCGWYELDPTALRSTTIAQSMLGRDVTAHLHFFPANDPKIHVCEGVPLCFSTRLALLMGEVIVRREMDGDSESVAQGWNLSRFGAHALSAIWGLFADSGGQ